MEFERISVEEELGRLQEVSDQRYAESALSRRRSIQALYLTITAVLLTLSALGIFLRADIEEATRLRPFAFLLPLGTSTVFSGGMLLYIYLRGWQRNVRSGRPAVFRDHFSTTSSFSARIETLEERVAALELAPAPLAQAANAADVAQIILPQVQSDLVGVFEASYKKKSELDKSGEAIAHRFDAAVKRLEREIEEQSRKGNVNLIIGVGTTLLAVGLLVYIVLYLPQDNPTWTQLASHYIPRLSLVIFIEIFSFFFLRLYKTTLEEARRYNDDLTRLTLQWVAADTGRHAQDEGAISGLAKELLNASKPPKASSESPRPMLNTDKAFKAMLDALSKQLDGKGKKDGKGESAGETD